MTNQMNELHGRIQNRQRQKVRAGRHFMAEARKAAATELIRRESIDKAFLDSYAERKVKIWTDTDAAWWREYGCGITTEFCEAASYTLATAYKYTSGSTPGKLAFRFADEPLSTGAGSNVDGSAPTSEPPTAPVAFQQYGQAGDEAQAVTPPTEAFNGLTALSTHEATTDTHTDGQVERMVLAAVREGLDPLYEWRRSQSRMVVTCTEAQWKAIQEAGK
jgi:hypothetical protein